MEKGWSVLSKKIRVTPELVEKARKIFEKAKKEKKAVTTTNGLSRTEMRALERKGYVRKMSIFGAVRYAGSRGGLSYVWSWVGIE